MWEEAWERAVEAALHAGGKGSSSPARSLTLDDAVKCIHGREPAADILERHQSLEHLSIAGVGVTSLEGFPRLRNLTRLTLSDNRIAGGLDHLVAAGLFSLRALDVGNNCIQDVDDLTPLADLRLMSLDLYGCPVTRAKDYRSRVFGMIRTLKYLDKMMDADENERPVSEMGKATATKPQAMAIGSDFDAAPDDADEDREEINDDCEEATDQPSSSQGTKRKRDDSPPKSSSSSNELLKKRKRATKSNTIEEEAASASPVTKESSSAVSSPLRFPYIPRTVKGVDSFGREILEPFVNIDPSIISAHRRLIDKYDAKIDRIMKLHSMDQNVSPSCLVDPDLLPVRSSATKTVLRIAKVVLGLSSYLDGLPLARSSGFLIDWDADSKIGIILTSAFLIRSKCPSIEEWLAKDVYAPHAEVCVHLLDKDDTNVIAELVFYDKHYNIALFKAVVDLHAQIPPFSSEVNCAQEVFILGRDESRNLSIDHGSVEYKDPGVFKRHHYMYVNCGIKQLVIGGPVINFDGEIMGMASHPQTAFMPSSIILKCLHMWKKFNCIPRLHIGMKFSVIIFMDPSLIEKISRKCGTDAGLVVTQVSEGSVAEKYGIRAGDIIKYWNGEKISTTVELENFLLCLCEEHLDKGNIIGSTVDISIDILHVRKDFNDTIKLTANVSKDVEIIAEGTYAVTSKDCAPGHDDDEVYGEEASHGISDEGVGDTTSIPFRRHVLTVNLIWLRLRLLQYSVSMDCSCSSVLQPLQ